MALPPADVFRFCPRCGTQSSLNGANPFRCSDSDCAFDWYFTPPAAVGALIANPEGQLLLLVRGNDPGRGRLGVPGGFVDPGESLEEALIREVHEETSLRVTQHCYLTSAPNLYEWRGVALRVIDAYFVCQVESFDCFRPQESEVAGWKYVELSPDMPEQMAFPSAQHAVLKYLRTR